MLQFFQHFKSSIASRLFAMAPPIKLNESPRKQEKNKLSSPGTHMTFQQGKLSVNSNFTM